MASYRTNTDLKAIETNYSKRLSIFANKLHQHTIVLKQQLTETKRINTSLLGKLRPIRQLNKPMTLMRALAYFDGIEQSNVLTTVEIEASTEIRRILQIFKDQRESIDALRSEYKKLSAACTALGTISIPFKINGPMPPGVSPLYSGNSRQKSMHFYQSASKILFDLDTARVLCRCAGGVFFSKFPKDFEEFQQYFSQLDGKIQSLDDYLMFCSFMINQ